MAARAPPPFDAKEEQQAIGDVLSGGAETERCAARAPLGEVAGVRDAHLFALAHPRDGGWCISCCQEQKRTRANAKCPGVEFDLAVLFFMLHCVLFFSTLQLH